MSKLNYKAAIAATPRLAAMIGELKSKGYTDTQIEAELIKRLDARLATLQPKPVRHSGKGAAARRLRQMQRLEAKRKGAP